MLRGDVDATRVVAGLLHSPPERAGVHDRLSPCADVEVREDNAFLGQLAARMRGVLHDEEDLRVAKGGGVKHERVCLCCPGLHVAQRQVAMLPAKLNAAFDDVTSEHVPGGALPPVAILGAHPLLEHGELRSINRPGTKRACGACGQSDEGRERTSGEEERDRGRGGRQGQGREGEGACASVGVGVGVGVSV